MTKEEYGIYHFLINETIRNIRVTDEKFEELSDIFESLDSDIKRLVSQDILNEIAILFKARGIKVSIFKKIINEFCSNLFLHEIFVDKIYEQKTTIDPPVMTGVK